MTDNKIVKLFLITLALVLPASLALLAGCKGGGKSEFTQEELKDILSESSVAASNAESLTFEMNLAMDIEMKGGPDAGTGRVEMNMDGAFDEPGEEMKTVMDMSLDAPGDEEDMDISFEIYMSGGYLYIKANIPDMPAGWIKVPAESGMMDSAGMDALDSRAMMEELLPMLDSAADLEFLRYENFDGGECYVIGFVLDWETLFETMNQMQPGTEFGFDQGDFLSSMEDVFDELSFNTWIDTGSKQMKKLEFILSSEIDAEDFGEPSGESVKLDITMIMTMSDYNEPVEITVPPEAENAELIFS